MILGAKSNGDEICQGLDWGVFFPTSSHGVAICDGGSLLSQSRKQYLGNWLQPWSHIPCPENLRFWHSPINNFNIL
jgi:hypothetical protein